jgi:hypothetical protein
MTYENHEVNGCIDVTAPGVVIRYVKVHCASFEAVGHFDYGPTVDPGPTNQAAGTGRVTVQDSEIDCMNSAGRTALGDTSLIGLRLNVHGCENGADVDQYVTLTDSYIHNLANTAASHTDGVQLAHYLNGCTSSACEVNHARVVLLQHNTIEAIDATSALISNPVGDENITLQTSLLTGGAYTVYCDYQGVASHEHVVDNRFIRTSTRPNSGAFGVTDGCTDEEQVTGNVWDDTGTPIPVG